MSHKSILFVIDDWFTCTFQMDLYMSKSLTHNIARISVKQTILKKYNIIPLIVKELIEKFEYTEANIKIQKLHIDFPVIAWKTDPQALRDFGVKLKTHLKTCITENWNNNIIVSDDNLQSHIIKLFMKNPKFKLEASIHYASKYGAKNTLDLLDTIENQWSIRV